MVVRPELDSKACLTQGTLRMYATNTATTLVATTEEGWLGAGGGVGIVIHTFGTALGLSSSFHAAQGSITL